MFNLDNLPLAINFLAQLPIFCIHSGSTICFKKNAPHTDQCSSHFLVILLNIIHNFTLNYKHTITCTRSQCCWWGDLFLILFTCLYSKRVALYIFIHSAFISSSLIGSLVSTQSVLKMSTALRVLRPDYARCFWRVIVTTTDPFFHCIFIVLYIIYV